MELYLTLLISLHMIPIQVARGQNSILRSNVCQNISSNAQCAAEYHTLTCPANASIFILEAENDFVFSPSPQASCAGGVCDEQCCSRDNFQCSYPLSSDSFLSYINSCWGYRMCTNNAAFNPRTLTEGNRNCSGTAALASVSYLCINNLSVVRFDDKRNVSGTAVVARYLDTETNTSSCLEPQNTLKCDITLVGAGSKGDVRVMLVLRHPQLANNCSMLSIPEKNLSSDSQSCKQSLVTYNTANITLPGNSASQSIELTLLEGNHPIQAWAVVISNTASLEMQCGRGTCTPTAGDVSALVTAVVVLSLLCLVLVFSLIALTVICWRRRPVPRDPTYAVPMSLQSEERRYETLNKASRHAPRREANSVHT